MYNDRLTVHFAPVDSAHVDVPYGSSTDRFLSRRDSHTCGAGRMDGLRAQFGYGSSFICSLLSH